MGSKSGELLPQNRSIATRIRVTARIKIDLNCYQLIFKTFDIRSIDGLRESGVDEALLAFAGKFLENVYDPVVRRIRVWRILSTIFVNINRRASPIKASKVKIGGAIDPSFIY